MTHERGTWKHELGRRAGTLWALKMFVTTGGIALFFYAYFWVMHHPLSSATVMSATWIDELIFFQPESFVLYISLWVYVALGSAFLRDARELVAWGTASLVMIVVGLGIFLALPTEVPEFAIDWSLHPSLAFLKTVDATGNACPSLHAAFAVFTAVVLHATLTAVRAPRALLAINALWCLGIVYSTIATRQHVALDVIAGALLAAGASLAYVSLSAGRPSGRGRPVDLAAPRSTHR